MSSCSVSTEVLVGHTAPEEVETIGLHSHDDSTVAKRFFFSLLICLTLFAQPPLYDLEMNSRLLQPGVAVGLAWTVAGGEIMFVEASRMDGEGQLVLTGQLGSVMKESAKLALNWLRIHADNVRTHLVLFQFLVQLSIAATMLFRITKSCAFSAWEP